MGMRLLVLCMCVVGCVLGFRDRTNLRENSLWKAETGIRPVCRREFRVVTSCASENRVTRACLSRAREGGQGGRPCGYYARTRRS